MTGILRMRHFLQVGLAVGLMLGSAALWAADSSKSSKNAQNNTTATVVEMFAAIEKGDIAVKLVPKDSSLCSVVIENKTKQPLNVKLPSAFAGVPVLTQLGGGMNTGQTGGLTTGGGGGGQGIGGGMTGMGGGMGGGGGMFSVPAEKVGNFKVPTVCLEHGKPEPRSSMTYAIKQIDDFTDKPGVRELCEALGAGQVNQRAAQAAAWHLNNDMSWQELAAKQIRHAGGAREPYFSQAELMAATQLSSASQRVAKEKEEKQSETTESVSKYSAN